MKQFIKEYFNFTSSEKNGILVLLILIFLLILVWKLIPYVGNSSNNKIEKEIFEKEIAEFENNIINDTQQYVNIKNDSIHYFNFNPNSLSDSGWLALGLTEKQIKGIRNFQEKGGNFKKKEDLKKLYSLKPDQYEKLAPFIHFPEKEYKTTSLQKKDLSDIHDFDPNCTSHEDWLKFGLSEKQIVVINNFISKGGKFRTTDDFKKMYCIQPDLFTKLESYIFIMPEPEKNKNPEIQIIIEINSADSAEFRKIKGISPYLAKNIVKYRNALGGFISKNQMKEVWGFKPELYKNTADNFICNKIQIKQLNLNTSTFAEFIKHPYLNYELTKSILNYKKIVGKIKNVNELSKNGFLPDTVVEKIKPYLLTE